MDHRAAWATTAAVAYALVQRLLRYRRKQGLYSKYTSGFATRSLASMTDTEAREILSTISDLEFPYVFELGLQFALFRTYGIPTISKTLMATKEFSTESKAPKRLADTQTLITELYQNPPTSLRTKEAFARMNYIHSVWQKSGGIKDDDMLYTLSLFAWEPIRWINRHEWRQITDLEKCAFGTFHKSMGDAMKISYKNLSSHKEGWKDGLHWMDDLATWSEEYEAKNMVPNKDNHNTAEQTTSILVAQLPTPLRSLGRQFVKAIMDDRLRMAMVYNEPAPTYRQVLVTLLGLRKFMLKHLALPRPNFLAIKRVSSEDSATGYIHVIQYDAYPYYIKPTIWNRWGPSAWLKWASGVALPGEKYYPEGYKIKNVGPDQLIGKGEEHMEETKGRLTRERRGQCPFG